MTRWYRSYCDQHRNPKVVALSDKDFRLWHELLGIASENDGIIPPLPVLRSLVSVRYDRLTYALKCLLASELIDTYGDSFRPRNWDKRQYKSDSSAARVKKHREKCNAFVTSADTDTEKEKKESSSETKVSSLAAKYVFQGQVIRLTPKDFDKWRKTYRSIPDLMAELQTIDGWLVFTGGDVAKNWFHAVPKMLNKKHQEYLKGGSDGDDDPWAFMRGPLRG